MDTEFYKNILPLLRKELATGEGPARIFCPYLTGAVEHILSSANPEHCEIYTRLDIVDLLVGASDINVLRNIHQKGFKLFEIEGLHAKVVLIGDDLATIGSQNLTTQSSRNKELTAVFRDTEEVASIRKSLENWVEQRREITETALNELLTIVGKLRPEFQRLLDHSDRHRLIHRAESLVTQLSARVENLKKGMAEDIERAKGQFSQARRCAAQRYETAIQTFREQVAQVEDEIDAARTSLEELYARLKDNSIATPDDLLGCFFNDLDELCGKIEDEREKLHQQIGSRRLTTEGTCRDACSQSLQAREALHEQQLSIFRQLSDQITQIRTRAEASSTTLLSQKDVSALLEELERLRNRVAKLPRSHLLALNRWEKERFKVTDSIKEQLDSWLAERNAAIAALLDPAKPRCTEIVARAREFTAKVHALDEDRRLALEEFAAELPRLGESGLVQRELAQRLVASSDWWLTQKHHPVRAPKNAQKLRGSELKWYMQYKPVQFLVARAVLACQGTLYSFVNNAQWGRRRSYDDLIETLRLDLRSSVANAIGHEYSVPYDLGKSSKPYRNIEKHMVFGGHSVDTQAFILELLRVVRLPYYKARLWPEVKPA